MANERITPSMGIKEMLTVMSQGNPGAIECMIQWLKSDPMAIFDILYLDTLGIYGSKIYMLWNDCCGRDLKKLTKTIHYFQSGQISKEEIHENLDRIRAVPFI